MGSPRETYLKQLERWEFNLALGSQWVLNIFSFPNDILSKVNEYESIAGNGVDWKIGTRDYNLLTSQEIQNTGEMGCFFVDNVTLPGDGFNQDDASVPNSSGFIINQAAGKRSKFTRLKTTFRETNLDFIDAIIRPWIIMGSYRGFFAYENERDRVKIPLVQLIHYSRYRVNERRIRKIYSFYNVAPVEVPPVQYNYTPDVEAKTVEVGWIFDNYSVRI